MVAVDVGTQVCGYNRFHEEKLAEEARKEKLASDNAKLLTENLTLRKRIDKLTEMMAALEQQVAAIKENRPRNTEKRQPQSDDNEQPTATKRKRKKKGEKKVEKPLEEMEINEETHESPLTPENVTDPPSETGKTEKIPPIVKY